MVYKQFLSKLTQTGFILLALLCGAPSVQQGQSVSEPSVQVADVRLTEWVSAEITIRSPNDGDLVLPSCDDGTSAVPQLCQFPNQLQLKTDSSWVSVTLQPPGRVFSRPPLTRWKAQTVKAGGQRTFRFRFPKGDFAVRRGQLLRLVLDAWPDEQSMQNHAPTIRLISREFQCP